MSQNDTSDRRIGFASIVLAVAFGAMGLVAGVLIAEFTNNAARSTTSLHIQALEQELTVAKNELAAIRVQSTELQQTIAQLKASQAQELPEREIDSEVARVSAANIAHSTPERVEDSPRTGMAQSDRFKQDFTGAGPIDSGIRSGTATGGRFSFENLSATAGDFGLEVMGDMRNESGSDWATTIFQVSAYDPSNRLVGVSGFFVNNFESNATASFTATFLDVPGSAKDITFRLHFQGGVER